MSVSHGIQQEGRFTSEGFKFVVKCPDATGYVQFGSVVVLPEEKYRELIGEDTSDPVSELDVDEMVFERNLKRVREIKAAMREGGDVEELADSVSCVELQRDMSEFDEGVTRLPLR